ncbi:MAG TPA: NHL repeat-containing protein [bacterium]|nr:NHL repeat-containing protein [bacterium]
MAKKKLITKSFRTLVGALGPEIRHGQGVYIYDTNDSEKDYAFFTLLSGASEKAERFAIDFVSQKTAPYLDCTRSKNIAKPDVFLRSIITELLAELEKEGLVEHGSTRHNFCVVFVKSSTMYIGRVNSCPVFYMKDRKLRQLFKQPRSRGEESIQIGSVNIENGDKLVLCNEDLIKNLTKLELRNLLLTENDLSLLCSKIQMLAARYEETEKPRLAVVNFKENPRRNISMLNSRNIAMVAALAFFIMLLFSWGDITRMIHTAPLGYIVKKQRNIVERAMDKVIQEGKLNKPELVVEGLRVPYDAVPDGKGNIYIVDDGESKIIKFNAQTGQKNLIGEKIKLQFPTGIDIIGDRLYATDLSQQVSKVFIFKTDGTYVGRAPDDRSIMVSMHNPKSVAAVKGILYVCDRGNNRILSFDPDGTFQKKTDLSKGYREPNGIAVTEGGDLFVTMKLSGIVAKISGKNITPFTLFREENGETKKVSLSKPSGIAVDALGFVYISDTSNKRLVAANPMGSVIGILDQDNFKEFETAYPMGVKVDSKNNYLYLVTSNRYSYDSSCEGKCNGKVWRIKI